MVVVDTSLATLTTVLYLESSPSFLDPLMKVTILLVPWWLMMKRRKRRRLDPA